MKQVADSCQPLAGATLGKKAKLAGKVVGKEGLRGREAGPLDEEELERRKTC